MPRLRFLGLALGLALAAALAHRWATARPVAPHPFFASETAGPLVIAHADDTGRGLWPGNTLPFLEGAARLGVDVLEMDVHLSRDGVPVLMHDGRVERTTDGVGAIRAMRLSELQALEVAGDWSRDGGVTYPYRGRGLRVPTLEAVFERFPDARMNIELKQREPSPAAAVCALIRRFGRERLVLVASFHDRTLDEFRDACPSVATSAASGEVKRFLLAELFGASALLRPRYQALQLPLERSGLELLSVERVRAAQRRGVQVHAWTINDPAVMMELRARGVDGILTDRPDLLRALPPP